MKLIKALHAEVRTLVEALRSELYGAPVTSKLIDRQFVAEFSIEFIEKILVPALIMRKDSVQVTIDVVPKLAFTKWFCIPKHAPDVCKAFVNELQDAIKKVVYNDNLIFAYELVEVRFDDSGKMTITLTR